MIITYLTHDILSLRACSFTSRSWYIAAVPRLHRTLAAQTDYITNKEVLWPKPLRVASKFGFLPFVTRVVISGSMCHRFSTKKFNKRTRREFSQLTNVQKLSITALATPSFTPRIREYFWQFSSTLRSLTLANAEGSGRHVVFFIGLFPHLEDLRLLNCLGHLQWNQEDDLTLVPSFVPSLRGGLTVHCCRDGIVRAIIDLFGEIRFRHMDLVGCGIQQLVYACPNTLETLKLDAIDICGETLPPKDTRALVDGFTGTPALDLDLSRNKSLRKLEITAKTISMY